jgi:hypothetical protein
VEAWAVAEAGHAISDSKGAIMMGGRHILSIALILIGIVLFVVLLVADQWLIGLLIGLIFAIAGVLFYRRGK